MWVYTEAALLGQGKSVDGEEKTVTRPLDFANAAVYFSAHSMDPFI